MRVSVAAVRAETHIGAAQRDRLAAVRVDRVIRYVTTRSGLCDPLV